MNIDKKFYKAGKHPVAQNVGELKALLAELPDDLPLSDGWQNAPCLIVYNYGQHDVHLQLCEQEDDVVHKHR